VLPPFRLRSSLTVALDPKLFAYVIVCTDPIAHMASALDDVTETVAFDGPIVDARVCSLSL
jgi:hypothetical protein